jgi:hypothetical protein
VRLALRGVPARAQRRSCVSGRVLHHDVQRGLSPLSGQLRDVLDTGERDACVQRGGMRFRVQLRVSSVRESVRLRQLGELVWQLVRCVSFGEWRRNLRWRPVRAGVQPRLPPMRATVPLRHCARLVRQLVFVVSFGERQRHVQRRHLRAQLQRRLSAVSGGLRAVHDACERRSRLCRGRLWLHVQRRV